MPELQMQSSRFETQSSRPETQKLPGIRYVRTPGPKRKNSRLSAIRGLPGALFLFYLLLDFLDQAHDDRDGVGLMAGLDGLAIF